jgi:predicted permease
MLHAIRSSLRAIFRRTALEREMQAEMSLHLEQSVERLVQRGMSEADAGDTARREFGNIALIQDQGRDARGARWVELLVQDVRYAARLVRLNPGFIVAVSLTLALGIGVTAAMFSVVDRLLVRPPAHLVEAGRLRRVYATTTIPGLGERTFNRVGYVLYSLVQHGHAFDGVAASGKTSAILGSGVEAREVDGASATANFFSVVGVKPTVGRVFTAAEDDPRAPADVVVLSHEFWQRELGGSPAVLRNQLTIDNRPFTIIGVLPSGFTGTELKPADFWVPLSSTQNPKSDWTTTWRRQVLSIVVRLKPGTDVQATSRELTDALRQTDAIGMWKTAVLSIRPISSDETGQQPAVYSVARWLTGVAVVVLLIACANVTNLFLARSLARRREIAVRLALGISVSRLVRLLLTESFFVAVLGGIGGAAIAYGGGELIRRRFLADVAWDSPPVDQRVLILTLALTIVSGLVVGILPALFARHTDVVTALKGGSRGCGLRQGRLRTGLLVAESALAVALMVTAGLFIRSLTSARAVDLGFQPRRVLSAAAQWAPDVDRVAKVSAWEQARRRVSSVPAFEHAALAIGSPFGANWNFGLRIPGRDTLPALGGPAMSAVSADYFLAVGTRLVAGRYFVSGEGAGTEAVAIINETMARVIWPNESALGHCVIFGGGKDVPCSRIVGVVRDASRSSLREAPMMQCYVPFGQERGGLPFADFVEMIVRPRAGSTAIASLRELLVHEMPDARFVRVIPLEARIDPLIRPWRVGAELFAAFGLLALIVAAAGLYSVIAYVTTQRTHEFGVRIALGAQPGALMISVLGNALRVAFIGTMLGVGLSIIAAPKLEPLLFETSGRDWLVMVAVAAVSSLVALIASVMPAWRATRVDPLVALRVD